MDRTKILEAIGGDEEMLAELMKLFFDQFTVLHSEMHKALSTHDHELLFRSAHTLKGSALALLLKNVSDMAAEIEKTGRAKSTDGVSKILNELEAEVQHLKPLFADLLT